MFLLICQQLSRTVSRTRPITLIPSPVSYTVLSAAALKATSHTATPSSQPQAFPTTACSLGPMSHPSLSSSRFSRNPCNPHSQTPRINRGFATSAPATPTTPTPAPDNEIYILPMPRLSHEMEVGTVVKWLKKQGDSIDMYDLLCEVSTDTLVTAEFKEGAFAGTVNLLIESQEYGILSRVLVQEGQTVKVGTPIAVVAEGPGSPAAVMAEGYACETGDVYDAEQPQVKVLTWQSYLAGPKEGEEKAEGGANGSCM